MNEVDALDIARQAVFVLVKVSAPPLLSGLVIGLIISLFQALTQIQEMTLTFVPKVLVVFLSLILFAPFMLGELAEFTRLMFDRMVAG
jgi:flagellar biosynthetic protein FliQ